ncbi:MAG: hypothetical protein V3R93_03380, partial [Candidatus Hydrothermarchaeaceae archaeon]
MERLKNASLFFRFIKFISWCLVFSFVLSTQAIAATYYVSTTGNDLNPCTGTGTSACATVNGAIGKASSGDTIKIEAGNYTLTSGNYIVVTGKTGLTITADDPSNK